MRTINNIFSKLDRSVQESKPIEIRGISSEQWLFLTENFLPNEFAKHTHVYVCKSSEQAENLYAAQDQTSSFLFLGHDYDLYSSILSSESGLFQRIATIIELIQASGPIKIFTTLEALHLKLPPKNFFEKSLLQISVNDIISPLDLAKKLVEIGYSSTSSVEEPGTFAKKGEIFDIYPVGQKPIRLHYFDDLIENIYYIDQETQKTVKETPVTKAALYPAPQILCQEEFSSVLRKSITQFQPGFKYKYDQRKNLFNHLSNGQLFENYPLFFPLFFEEQNSLFDYLPDHSIITLFENETSQKEFEFFKEKIHSTYIAEKDSVESHCIAPGTDKFYFSDINPRKFSQLIVNRIGFDEVKNEIGEVNLSTNSLLGALKISAQGHDRFSHIKILLSSLCAKLSLSSTLYVAYQTPAAKEEIQFLLKQNEFDLSKIKFFNSSLAEGFYLPAEDIYVLSESDLFVQRKAKSIKQKKPDYDLFAEQIATLKENDYVVHRDHGVGLYKGLETIKVGDQTNDFLVLVYEDGDKVYVPVYKMNLIQKHADAHAGLKVASLKTKKFQEAKARAYQAVKKLAFDLLKLQAERKLRGGFRFSPPDHLFKEFELAFPYQETPDQLKAIDDVIEDMMSGQPMDRLVCGDVGFGKTEVAIRASFKAVLDKKQVVVLVPTTILALQHYHSFSQRFKDFPVSIDFISRFKTATQKKEIYKKVSEGKIDILIGTHAVLSDQLVFKDLGLLVIDEEHRFGVGHKEKVKLLKANLDVLTMTATPIPRTLQMSFLGIRDLSLIQTAPPSRQSIKTYIIKNDDLTIKEALEKELSRGGQAYFLHNRVNDIEEVALYLKELVPKARVVVTHGQMGEKELETRINDFYEHKADILLSTTIIESGIDIPNANTMIIDRADTFGLAQLHQLRGRIGRSDRKAYAYFIVPESKIISETAERRLHALKTYAEIGSGFSLASSDLEIRGAGDILGAEQSGHIESIGLELYMDLLQETIQELKGENYSSNRNVEIQTSFAAFIPNKYIPDASLRLKYYKRLSNAHSEQKIEETIDEIQDLFGLIPQELLSLVDILKARILFQRLGLKTVKVGQKNILLFFDQEFFAKNVEIRDKLIQHFVSRPKHYKINPDASVDCSFKDNVSRTTLLDFAKHIAQQI